jgi:hypothetical protein
VRAKVIQLSVAALCSALIVGCGGSSSSSKATSAASRSSPSAAVPSTEAVGNQATAPALAACRRAVARPPSLSASTKREIGELCDRINDVIEDNEATVRAVCQELANAATSANTSSRKSVFSDCYAEYAKTIK